MDQPAELRRTSQTTEPSPGPTVTDYCLSSRNKPAVDVSRGEQCIKVGTYNVVTQDLRGHMTPTARTQNTSIHPSKPVTPSFVI